jgi:type II secretory pathway component PulF
MLGQAVTGIAIQRTVQAALDQMSEGNSCSALLEQTQEQGIFRRRAVKNLSINEQQALLFKVLHDMSVYSGQLAQLKMLD